MFLLSLSWKVLSMEEVAKHNTKDIALHNRRGRSFGNLRLKAPLHPPASLTLKHDPPDC